MWFSYLEMNEHLSSGSRTEYENYVENALNNCVSMGINTVYVHLRAHADSYYPSELFCWSDYKKGVGTSPGFDPIQIFIDKAHSKGLSFHAWINPMRIMSPENVAKMPDNYKIKQWYNDSSTKGKYIVKPSNDQFYWLNPAYEEVREFINDGIEEIMQNYSVDGIHIDDYFYPTTASSFDKSAFEVSGMSDLAKFRHSCTDKMVEGMYSTVKSINSEVLFGVSPQGNMQNNYDLMYADVKKWCSQPGYLDYIVPQIYFGFDNATQPFDKVVTDWQNIVTLSNVDMVVGIAAYKANGKYSDFNYEGIIVDQVEYCWSLSGNDGFAFYRYDHMVGNVTQRMKNEVEKLKDLLN